MRSFSSKGRGKKSQVCVFDKLTGNNFRTSPENICARRDFNTIEHSGGFLCLEGIFSEIEGVSSPIIKRICDNKSINDISDKEWKIIATLAAVQKIRGTSFRAQSTEMTRMLSDRIRKKWGDHANLDQPVIGDEESEKEFALGFMIKYAEEFATHFLNKIFVLFECSGNFEFLLGDAAISWTNQNDMGPRGNLGLNAQGIEIYLPISPNLTLGFWCPTVFNIFTKSMINVEKEIANNRILSTIGSDMLRATAKVNLEKLEIKKESLKSSQENIRNGNPLHCSLENVVHFNALQIREAERYIISKSGNFDLVKNMIKEDSRYRNGARFSIS